MDLGDEVMPAWVQFVIGAAAVVMALGTLWKVILPGAKLIAEGARLMPVLRDLLAQFGEAPGALSVLKEVAAQFRTDSGSSLRDAVNRLEDASRRLEGRAQTLELRDEEDRTRAARLAAAVDVLNARVGAGVIDAAAAQLLAGQSRASIQSSVDRLTTPATTPAPAGPPAPPAPATPLAAGDQLVVTVDDIKAATPPKGET